MKSLTKHSRIAPAARLEGVDSGGGSTIYIYIEREREERERESDIKTEPASICHRTAVEMLTRSVTWISGIWRT